MGLSLLKKNKNRRRKRKFKDVDEKIEECQDPRKTKVVVELNNHESASIKSFAVKNHSSVKLTSCFMSRKLLMFAKLSLMSFIYEVIETFCFPDENVREIFEKYRIEWVEIFHVLTDTDSTSLKFIFVSDPNSETSENKYRDIICEIITSLEIYKRYGSLHEFWEISGASTQNTFIIPVF